MSRRHLWAGGVLLGLALASVACDVKVGDNGVSVDLRAGKATDEWVRSYDIKPGGSLDIININGANRKPCTATGTQVEVRATPRSTSRAARRRSRELLA